MPENQVIYFVWPYTLYALLLLQNEESNMYTQVRNSKTLQGFHQGFLVHT